MIVFPSESLYELRRSLASKMKSGELSVAEAFRRALEADPDDPMALLRLGVVAEDAGDLAEAERLARAAIRNHPSGHEGFMLLQRVLEDRGADPQLAEGYAMLGLEKTAYSEEALEKLDFTKLLPGLPAAGDRKYELLQMMIEHLKRKQLPEPPAVVEELEPHRLIHELRETGDDPAPRELVDRILASAADCAPMLLGILKEYAENLIPEEDDPMVLRALALLGEIGDPAALPAITEFLDTEIESFQENAHWAFHRIAFRRPADALKAISPIIPQLVAGNRAAVSLQIAEMPAVPGRIEVLQTVLDNLEREQPDEQEGLVTSVITAALAMQGANSGLAASLLKQFDAIFSPSTRKALRTMRAQSAMGPYVATEDPVTIYEICGLDHGPSEPVVKAPKPGRNDPCWCGSGKKYKKCHLDSDEGR